MMVPDKKILHTVFDATAEKFSQNIAVVKGSQSISYEALKNASDKIACQLRSIGVRKDTIAGIVLQSGVEYIASIIGVLKANGVFLPLDMDFPDKRLEYILGATAPSVIITDKESCNDVSRRFNALSPDGNKCSMLVIDEDLRLRKCGDEIVIESETNSIDWPLPGPDDSNYIMYTSGSTGAPKAIVGCHKSLSHFMHWEIKEFGFDHTVCCTQFAPVTFDASLRDIFVPLLTGGSVCIPEVDDRANAKRLIKWIEDTGVTLIHCVPSLFRLITKELEDAKGDGPFFPKLKYLLMAGEALYGRDVSAWTDIVGSGVEIVNLYGASETTLIKTFHRISEPPANPNIVVPIGKPISNTAILILNGNELCDIGEIGDIYIKTPFRTKGYYNDPDLTNKSFVQNPLNDETEDIVYKTGDLGRFLPDRSVEFIGRLDSQVKVNGIRIELGEIEVALAAFEAIDQAVVLARQNSSGENTLVCYYTWKKETDAEAIRTYLNSLLPAYMTPAFYVHLDEFPLNINGKIDRKALPKPEELIFETIKYEAPSTPLEEELAQIWAEVLDLKKVGVNNSFFEIGGHSLKATRIVSRIYKKLGVEVSLKDFFGNSTIRKLACLVNSGAKSEAKAIEPLPPMADYALSHSQRRLWILEQMEPGSAAYNLPAMYMLEGRLNAPAFCRAFDTLIERHESLRATFIEVNGEPRQVINNGFPDASGSCVEAIDISMNADGKATLKEHVINEALAPFDITKGPLLKVKLFKLSHDLHALFMNIHHIISDAWSLDVLARETGALYEAYSNGKEASLTPLNIQHKDYAAAQNDILKSDKMMESSSYWRQKLSGDLEVLDLPADYPRPEVQTYNGKTFRFLLDADLTDGLAGAAKKHNASMFMALLSVVKILMRRYTGKSDIIIGSPAAGRNHPELEGQIGFFANTLALRDEVADDDSFATLLEKVKQTTIEAYDNQGYPFDVLVGELNLARDFSRAPLFDVMLVFQETALPLTEMGEITVKESLIEAGVCRFDLTFETVMTENGLRVGINYNTRLFSDDTIKRCASHFENIVKSVALDDELPITRLNMLSPDEYKAAALTFNKPLNSESGSVSIVGLFDDQVKLAPDNIAVIYEDKQISYKELNARADKLAGYLRDHCDVKPEDLVGVLIDRGEQAIICLLAALKSGGAYMPVDPSYPRERVNYMINDSRCRVFLTETKYFDIVKGTSVAHVVDVEKTENLAGFNREGASGAPCIGPDNLAYVIYTSGSTGKPKGVMIEHGGFVNMSLDQIRTFGVSENDRVLQFASLSFDASMSEIFMALFSGGAIVAPNKEAIDDPVVLTKYMADNKVTNVTFPPAYLHAIDRNALKSVTTIITAGESPILDDAAYYSGNKNYFNAYGPTETSVCAAIHKAVNVNPNQRTMPIGRPVSGMGIYILDGLLNHVPIGVAGEICVSGVGVARGYLNQPDLTGEKFVKSPFIEGERLYRTGDCGRFNSRGEVVFLGRNDEQVKVNGRRVELGEIEQTLLLIKSIKQASVITKGKNVNVLAAYIVSDEELQSIELRKHLSEYLPDYMIPNHFTLIKSMPLTGSGKINKKALLEVKDAGLIDKADYIAPQNDLELKLAGVWEEVLEREKIGVNDDFFKLGGSSLHSIQLIAKISALLGIELSVKLLFHNTTISDMAAAIDKQIETQSDETSRIDIENLEYVESEYQHIERRPLQGICDTGEMKPVDAAALIYLPDGLVGGAALDRDYVMDRWLNRAPVIESVIETSIGRAALITLPLFSSELYTDKKVVSELICRSMSIASGIGARAVSLTGLLPSAANYGKDILSELPGTVKLPIVTTGHATTTAAVILSIENILQQAGRNIENEIVGFLGMGSMGVASLRLLLRCLPQPKEIMICDVIQKSDFLETLKREIIDGAGFKGEVKIIKSEGEIPSGFYDSTLIVGATNVPDILDISKIRPGSLIVDDSGPHCFRTDHAVKRFNDKRDILFTEGGVLKCPTPITKTTYLPHDVENELKNAKMLAIINHKPFTITGCVLSALLSSRYEHIKPTTGFFNSDISFQNYQTLNQLTFKSADLHCENYQLNQNLITKFQESYGG